MWGLVAFIAGTISGVAGLVQMIADRKAGPEYQEELDAHLEEKYGLTAKDEEE